MISLLLVDDEPAILDITGIFLERSGEIKVEIASSAKMALEMIGNNNFDAIVSDYEMPFMNGIELLKSIRSCGNKIPFIIFTGKGREDVVIEALNEGVDYYIQKGGDPKSQFAELLNAIKKAVSLRNSERAIEDSGRRLSEIIEFLPDATFAIDKEGVIIEWNLAIEKMTGLKKEDMIGKGNYEYSLPAFGERIPILIDKVINPDSVNSGDKYCISNEGNRITAEVFAPKLYGGTGAYLWLKVSPLYGPDCKIEGAIESIRDITKQKTAEKNLLENEKILRTMMDNLPGIVYRCLNDSDWTMQFISAGCENLTGHPAEDLLNNAKLTYSSLIHPNDRTKVWDTIQQSLAELKPFQLIYRIRCKDGEEKWVWEQGRGIYEDGNLFFIEGLILDISYGKLAHDTISELNRKLSLLSSITRHDILNNLARATALLSFIEDDLKSDDAKNNLKNANHYLDTIRNQVVFTSRYYDLGLESSSWLNISDIVGDVSSIAGDNGISVENNTSGWEIYADPMIRGVLYNLMENSVRHGGSVKNISVAASKESEGLLISYRDDGKGIPAEKKEHIFESHYGENTGFGLFLSRKILGITNITIDEKGGSDGVLFEMFVPEGKYRRV